MAHVSDQDISRMIRMLLRENTPSGFGYKMQAVAAHVLARCGFEIEKVNQSGHPDILAERGGMQYAFEIEAEVVGPKSRQLSQEDFQSLSSDAQVSGWYALVSNFPTPHWILVPAYKLEHRSRATSVSMLMALSNQEFSDAWTFAYVEILQRSFERIRKSSFGRLSADARSGRLL